MIVINGEEISDEEMQELRLMFENDAKQFAGEFYEMDRSLKHRTNWPDVYRFVNSEWKTFAEATRALYAKQLNEPNTPEDKKKKISRALILQDILGRNQEKDNRLQLFPNTQQFEGDRHENKRIIEKFGQTPNLRAALLNAIATRH